MTDEQFASLSEQVQLSLDMSRQTQTMMTQFMETVFPAFGAQVRTEMREQISGLRAEMHEQIGGLRAEMHEQIGGLRAEMKQGFEDVRAELRILAADVSEIHRRLDYQIARIAKVEERVDLINAQ